MRLVLCDSHLLLLEALTAALTAGGHEVVAAVTTPQEALVMVAASDPDICVLDVAFPGDGGLQAARLVRERHPRTRVLILTSVTAPDMVSAALRAGVAGYTSKAHGVGDMLTVLNRIAAGEIAIDGELLRSVVTYHAAPPTDPTEELLRFLTPRERQVLHQILAGKSTRELARDLTIATSTARTHVQNVLVKLGVHSRLEAAAMVSRVRRPLTDVEV
jgi:two-component system nitrate/nitrite response regulator NarL